jgi:hypothetical protein
MSFEITVIDPAEVKYRMTPVFSQRRQSRTKQMALRAESVASFSSLILLCEGRE